MIAVEPPRTTHTDAAASAIVALLVVGSVGLLAPFDVDLATATSHAVAVVMLMSGLTMGLRLSRETT